MPGGELEPIARAGPALAEVAVELGEIFARAGLGPAAPGLRRPPAVAALRPSRGGNPATMLMVAAAAGLVGLGAGALVLRPPAAQAPTEAKRSVQARPQAPVAQAPVPPVALAQAASTPVVDSPPADGPPAARGSQAAARAEAQFHMKLARLGGSRPAQSQPPIRLREPMPMAQPASCEQDVTGAGCRRAVVQADRHLRAVYESAIRRGVPRSTLVNYRDRWADLRDRDTDDPTRLIQNYGALAYDLGRESPDDQDDASRPRGRSSLRALADLLLPWR